MNPYTIDLEPIILTSSGTWGGEDPRDIRRAVRAGLLFFLDGAYRLCPGRTEHELDDFLCAARR